MKHIQPHDDPSDPYFPFQWYLKNTGQNGGKAKLDLNVEAAWAQGVTGKNITTAIMDDGKLFFKLLCRKVCTTFAYCDGYYSLYTYFYSY